MNQEIPETKQTPTPKRFSATNLVFKTFFLAVLAALVYFGCQYFILKNEVANLSKQESQPADEKAKILSELSELMVLPSNEEPTIATVTDLGKLREQEFFARAQTGDKVIIYTQSKKAILYRPGVKKVVEIAPLSFENNF